MITKEILDVLIPKEFKYTSLGFNIGMSLALIMSFYLSMTTLKFFLAFYFILSVVQLWRMKDELRGFFS